VSAPVAITVSCAFVPSVASWFAGDDTITGTAAVAVAAPALTQNPSKIERRPKEMLRLDRKSDGNSLYNFMKLKRLPVETAVSINW
jgi:hypothetical protein